MNESEGYNQAYMFKKHCDMLISFTKEYYRYKTHNDQYIFF